MNRRYFLSGLSTIACAGLSGAAYAAGPVKKKGGGSTYTQLPMLTIFTRSRQHKHGILMIEMGLDSPDEALRQKISLSLPRLRDAFVRRLQPYAMSLNASSLIDLEYVTRELQAATDEVLQKKGAKVLLSSILLN